MPVGSLSRLAIQRTRLVSSKKEQLAKKARREIAGLIEKGKLETARSGCSLFSPSFNFRWACRNLCSKLRVGCRVKVESIINEDVSMRLLRSGGGSIWCPSMSLGRLCGVRYISNCWSFSNSIASSCRRDLGYSKIKGEELQGYRLPPGTSLPDPSPVYKGFGRGNFRSRLRYSVHIVILRS
jgi:hypothetical protein